MGSQRGIVLAHVTGRIDRLAATGRRAPGWACRRAPPGAEIVDTPPEPEGVASEHPQARRLEQGPLPPRLVDQPEHVRGVIARVEVDQDEIGLVALERERGEDPVIPDPGAPDAEIEDLDLLSRLLGIQSLFK